MHSHHPSALTYIQVHTDDTSPLPDIAVYYHDQNAPQCTVVMKVHSHLSQCTPMIPVHSDDPSALSDIAVHYSYKGRAGEANRCENLAEDLEFLGKFKSTTAGKCKTDLPLFTDEEKVYINCELKTEIGAGGNDAVFQNNLWYVQ